MNQRLYDIRYPGGEGDSLQWERDTGAVMVGGLPQAHNGLYGRVAYIHGAEIDLPLAIIRMDYRQSTGGGVAYTSPFLAAIHTNWNGSIEGGTLDSATAQSAQGAGPEPAGFVPWTGVGGLRDTWNYRTVPWNGSLLADQQDRSGLLYRRNRYVDPLTMRFTQEDPIGLSGGINLYGFAHGDPYSFGDPFGLCPGIPYTDQWDLLDCPPGYFTGLLTITGGIGGGLAGGTAGAILCLPTIGGAILCAAGGAAAGAAAGAKAGAYVGSAFDVGIAIAKALDNTGSLGDDITEWARRHHLNAQSATTRNLFANRHMTVGNFVARFRKGSIREVLPSEYLEMTVEEALERGGSTIRKLLTSRRFLK